ncbi:hypothetical protein ACAG39_02075 [Caldicellulosiruptoraceae bacterium PP1]
MEINDIIERVLQNDKGFEYNKNQFEKWIKETEFAIFKLREALFIQQGQLDKYVRVLNSYGIKLDTELVVDKFEASYEDGMLKILIYDVPPIYKVQNQADTFKWKDIIENAIKSLSQKPRFKKAFACFEYYVPHYVAIKADTDNRMMKTITDSFVTNGVIPNDTMEHYAFCCFGFPIENMFAKTYIKIVSWEERYRVFDNQPNQEIANKLPVI